MPDHHTIKSHKHLQIFGELLHNGNLWHLNRRSVAKAFAVGLFFAFVPVPFQMILSAGMAIIVHANLPLSIALVWITNPLTMPAIFYFCYLVGTWLLGAPEQKFVFEASWQWVVNSLSTIGPSFLLGCGVLATLFSILGYFGIQALWRYSVSKEWQKRSKR
ncbi:ATP-binding protein [Thalassotalea insulae]|uniref:ATP-binding protein n=2 Tax=Thalassotalea insulae TaxID=2056778 RepID=A0ABQ6GYI3_9GAMM|nr:ATP-binding protein [Thalassotalea insulae]